MIDRAKSALLTAIDGDSHLFAKEFWEAHVEILERCLGLAAILEFELRNFEPGSLSGHDFRDLWDELWKNFWNRRASMFARSLIVADRDLSEAQYRKAECLREFRTAVEKVHGDNPIPVVVDDKAVLPDGSIVEILSRTDFWHECPICFRIDTVSISAHGVCEKCLQPS